MEDFFKAIEGLSIHPKGKVKIGIKGDYKAEGLGNSHDFYDHRAYMSKDDIRKVDWKAYLRTRKLYLRQFTEEKQLPIQVILDCSQSMNTGENNKLEVAKQLASGIVYLGLKEANKVSVWTLQERIKVLIHEARGMEQFYSAMKIIQNVEGKGKTDYKQSIPQVAQTGGMTFVITDMLGEDVEYLLDDLIAHKEEIVLMHVLSEEELHPKFTHAMQFIDSETKQKIEIIGTREVHRLYREKLSRFLEDSKKQCLARNIQYVFSPTDKMPAHLLFKAIGGM